MQVVEDYLKRGIGLTRDEEGFFSGGPDGSCESVMDSVQPMVRYQALHVSDFITKDTEEREKEGFGEAKAQGSSY